MDMRTFAINVLGYQPGYALRGEELKAVRAAYDHFAKKTIDGHIERVAKQPQFISTNTPSGVPVEIMVQPNGQAQIVPLPEVERTPTGTYVRSGANAAIPLTNSQGVQLKNYQSPEEEDGAVPKFGQTNATTVTTTNAATPAPFDPTTLTNAAMIRDALHSGKIPDEQTALQLIKSLGSR